MHRNVTAVFRNYATAELVRQELDALGISSGDIHVIPDSDVSVGSDGRRSDGQYSDQLHDLHLPDDDLRTYQQSVRHGDYVVSAEVDEEQVADVQKIMSRPEEEAHNLNQRSSEFGNAELAPYSDPDNRKASEEWVARPDPDHADPYTRSYSRDKRLNDRN